MTPLLVGIVASLITEFFKRHPKVPLAPTNVVAIRSVVAVLSILGTVGTAAVNGTLADLGWEGILNQLLAAVESILVATGTYKLFSLGGENKKPA